MSQHRLARASALCGLILLAAPAFAQSALPPLPSQPAFPLGAPRPTIQREAIPSRPFSVVGPRGAVLGQQDGALEVWLFPRKILSNLHISARMEDYPVPIDVNEHASGIEVRPDSTILTFAHANFTLREIMLAPKQSPAGSGALILFQMEAVRPMTLTFSFTPSMQLMWPAASEFPPSTEWVPTAPSSGFYILHLNTPDHTAAIAMPTAEPGILEPYQERAANYPTQFVLRFDPARDSHTLFPLLITTADTAATSTPANLARQLQTLDQATPSIYAANQAYYQNLLNTTMSIQTPDTRFNDAFAWARLSIDQLRVETTPNHDEQALTAGFLGSGDSVRPGFGWFFGRDALWTLYATNSDGSFDTTRQEIEFLLHRQSPEGKIFHEWSQTANLVDWQSLPYEYASADATTLLPMAMNDYLRISGDTAFINAHWDNLLRAWQFQTTHDADRDGIYDNAQGTAWVESWIPSMPRQEIYLALLDEQASTAFASLARATGHADLAQTATARATRIHRQIEQEYYLPASNAYAFSWNGPAGPDPSATIFPAVAWWDGDTQLDQPQPMIARWASPEFSTDWGTRLVSDHAKIYDPISYHQGSVWPLFTGWVSLAEYRTGHPLSAYAHLMQNADLTWSQDLGNVTELLSGQFFSPLGRSSAHQLWSSAMVISPAVRGLFGLQWNVPTNTLTVTPNLPADWPEATVRNIPFGAARFDLQYTRSGSELLIEALRPPAQLKLQSNSPGATLRGNVLHIPLPPVEAALPHALPQFGATTQQLKVLTQQTTAHSLTLTLAGLAATTYPILLRENAPNLHIQAHGATLGPIANDLRTATIAFPPGQGYIPLTVTLSW